MNSNNPFGTSIAQPLHGTPSQHNPFVENQGAPSSFSDTNQVQDPWATTAPADKSLYNYDIQTVSLNAVIPTALDSPMTNAQQPIAMAYSQNPFAPPPYGDPQFASANPIDMSQQSPYLQSPFQSQPQPSGTVAGQNPIDMNQQSPYQQSPFQSQPQPSGTFAGQNPFVNPASPATSQPAAVVVSQHQTNPYASPQSMQGGAVVVSQYQSNPYASMFGEQQQSSAPIQDFNGGSQPFQQPNTQWSGGNSSANPFDPFATQSPDHTFPIASPSMMDPFHQNQNSMEYNRPHAHSTESEPYQPQAQQPPPVRRGSFEGTQTKAPVEEVQSKIVPISTQSTAATNENRRQYDEPSAEERQLALRPPSYEFGHRPDAQPDRDLSAKESPRNKYSLELARQAPPGASPLPKADLVRKKGFVLSRISFRTIVMKKWKQTFWVQYGPHTMLWFRSQSDFDDWLNNPYHTQTERNFLIKLAVNFVHDLYKPNVRGYQVTQARTKGYGNKLVRQFKLERWMDYGPTIAAAFGSYNPHEVDDLREALVECMRNTPLSGGIRATGAVRQRPPENVQGRRSDSPDSSHGEAGQASRDGRLQGGGYSRESFDNLPGEVEEKKPEPEKPAAEVDLMDMSGWEAPAQTPAAPPQYNYGGGQPQFEPRHSEPHQQFQYPQQQQPPNFSNALVASSQPQGYPGAPPMQQYPPQQPPHPYGNAVVPSHQGQPFPGAPQMPGQQFDPQSSWAPPVAQQLPPQQPPQQQQNPWMTAPQQQYNYAPAGPTL